MFNKWRVSGEHWIWINACAIGICTIMVVGLIGMILVRGMGYFWPKDIASITIQLPNEQTLIAGELIEDIQVTDLNYATQQTKRRLKIKTGNRDLYGYDFRWIWYKDISNITYPKNIIAIERIEWGNFYGYFISLVDNNNEEIKKSTYQDFVALQPKIAQLQKDIYALQKKDIGAINKKIEKLRLEKRRLALKKRDHSENVAEIDKKQQQLRNEYALFEQKLINIENTLHNLGSVRIRTQNNQYKNIPLKQVISSWKPNSMNVFGKTIAYIENLWSFVRNNPREANTEGGIFPAIFGTIIMVFLMTIFTTPMGVVAAIYMREYAKQGIIIRTIRICVNNLAGVPSIVYGVFGLGFFVYFMGGNIDKIFYPEALPAPTFGSPGILWASLTLALLTLPVVIVSTEEGLARIPLNLREGSMALGATKFETLYKVIIPMSSPAIMTGIILAIARASGEVAPLMLVGVVKLAPDLVIDTTAPFIHLERKFMHMGFHIYDVGFQSPNVDASTPLVYATSFLLLVLIIVLNLTAIIIRNKLREKFKQLDM